MFVPLLHAGRARKKAGEAMPPAYDLKFLAHRSGIFTGDTFTAEIQPFGAT
jgi:hypothetical protein